MPKHFVIVNLIFLMIEKPKTRENLILEENFECGVKTMRLVFVVTELLDFQEIIIPQGAGEKN